MFGNGNNPFEQGFTEETDEDGKILTCLPLLRHLDIEDNVFTGKLPSFIGDPRIRVARLPLGGRNLVLYMSPADVAAAPPAAGREDGARAGASPEAA